MTRRFLDLNVSRHRIEKRKCTVPLQDYRLRPWQDGARSGRIIIIIVIEMGSLTVNQNVWMKKNVSN